MYINRTEDTYTGELLIIYKRPQLRRKYDILITIIRRSPLTLAAEGRYCCGSYASCTTHSFDTSWGLKSVEDVI